MLYAPGFGFLAPPPGLSSFSESFQRFISICFLNYLFSSSDIPDMALNSCHILLHSLAALVRQGWCLLLHIQESILADAGGLSVKMDPGQAGAMAKRPVPDFRDR